MVRRCRDCAGRPRSVTIRPVVASLPVASAPAALRPVARLSLPVGEAEVRPAVLGLYERLGWGVHVIGRAAYLHHDGTGARLVVRWEGRADGPSAGAARQ
jgi:hypothetical protein